MNEAAPTWSTWPEVVSVVLAPGHLKKTVSVALIVGSVFFALNQLGVIVAGHANAVVWLKAAMTYLTPFLVSNIGVLSATRRSATLPPRSIRATRGQPMRVDPLRGGGRRASH